MLRGVRLSCYDSAAEKQGKRDGQAMHSDCPLQFTCLSKPLSPENSTPMVGSEVLGLLEDERLQCSCFICFYRHGYRSLKCFCYEMSMPLWTSSRRAVDKPDGMDSAPIAAR